MISAVLEGKLDKVSFEKDEVFGFEIPRSCPNVPATLLNPKNTWADKQAYDVKAQFLAKQFIKNFEQYAKGVSKEILDAAPRVQFT
jgi:phosphoenolpyruvate carboxykinase (ATP)